MKRGVDRKKDFFEKFVKPMDVANIKKDKNIVDYILEFNWIKSLIILVFSAFCVYLGSVNSLMCDNCYSAVMLLQTGYLLLAYMLLTGAYNLSKGIPLVR